MQCADPAAAVKGPEGEGKAEPAAAGKSGGRGAKGWQYRWARRAGGCEAAAACGARGGAGALRGDCSGWGGGLRAAALSVPYVAFRLWRWDRW